MGIWSTYWYLCISPICVCFHHKSRTVSHTERDLASFFKGWWGKWLIVTGSFLGMCICSTCTLYSSFIQIGKWLGSLSLCLSLLERRFCGICYRAIVWVLQRNPKGLGEVLPHSWHMNVKLLSDSSVKWLLVEQRSFREGSTYMYCDTGWYPEHSQNC